MAKRATLIYNDIVGTPFLHLASDVYETYRRVTGATLDESNQMLVDPTSLKSLFIVIKQVCILSWSFMWNYLCISVFD